MRWDNAVIFAGGRSSRMGKDKALLPFGGYGSLAEYQYRRLEGLFGRVMLSAKEEKFAFDAPVIVDRYPGSSPVIALASVLEEIGQGWVFVLSVDMPRVDATLIGRLHDARTQHPQARALVAASRNGSEPLCGLYHAEILPAVRAAIAHDQHRMRALLRAVPSAEVYCDRDEIFANLNTPEEYRRLRSADAATPA